MQITKDLTPVNHSKTFHKKTIIVLHDDIGTFAGTRGWFKDPIAKVSAQYIVGPNLGEIVQMVENKDFAWHAGAISNPSPAGLKVMKKNIWGRLINPNHYSIGIEFCGIKGVGITEGHLRNGAFLIRKLQSDPELYIPDDDDYVITHRDITSYKPNIDQLRNKLLKTMHSLPAVDSGEIKREIIELLHKL